MNVINITIIFIIISLGIIYLSDNNYIKNNKEYFTTEHPLDKHLPEGTHPSHKAESNQIKQMFNQLHNTIKKKTDILEFQRIIKVFQ